MNYLPLEARKQELSDILKKLESRKIEGRDILEGLSGRFDWRLDKYLETAMGPEYNDVRRSVRLLEGGLINAMPEEPITEFSAKPEHSSMSFEEVAVLYLFHKVFDEAAVDDVGKYLRSKGVETTKQTGLLGGIVTGAMEISRMKKNSEVILELAKRGVTIHLGDGVVINPREPERKVEFTYDDFDERNIARTVETIVNARDESYDQFNDIKEAAVKALEHTRSYALQSKIAEFLIGTKDAHRLLDSLEHLPPDLKERTIDSLIKNGDWYFALLGLEHFKNDQPVQERVVDASFNSGEDIAWVKKIALDYVTYEHLRKRFEALNPKK